MKILFKHSTRCPISRRAKTEMDAFLKNNKHHPDLEYELIDVIGNRERSNQVVEQYGIRHESPQIIILDDNGSVTWNASHRDITEENINTALN